MGDNLKIDVRNVNFFYGAAQALYDVSLRVPQRQVTALIGPSGCGKSTFLRLFNRMNDLIPGILLEGRVEIDGKDIYSDQTDVIELRRRVGMIFQKSNPFPMSIYDNVAYGVRVNGLSRNRHEIDRIVEATLRSAALWDEVKDRVNRPALSLSGGQQQRLCIARALARGAGCPVDGRAGVGPRSDIDGQDRGTHLPTEKTAIPSSSSPTICNRRRACPTKRPFSCPAA